MLLNFKVILAVSILISSSFIENQVTKSIILGVLAIFLIYQLSQNGSKLPPGPIALPILGSLPWLMKDPNNYMLYCKKKFGDLVTLKLGNVTNVIINDYEMIKEFSNLPTTQYRPKQHLFRKYLQGKGIIDAEGELWKHQRRFVLHSLRHAGIGKMKYDDNICHEISKMVDYIKRENGQPMTFREILSKVSSNVICSLAFNKAYDYDNPEFLKILHIFNRQVQLIGEVIFVSFFPWLASLVKHKEEKIFANYEELHSISRAIIEEHKKALDPVNPRDFIDLYLLEMRTEVTVNNKDYLETFSEEQLVVVVLNLFIAGTETSSTTTLWALALMAYKPEIQKKVQEEIDSVIGVDGEISSTDRYRLPYTSATLQEVERFATIAPRGIPRSNMVPIKFKDYEFPAHTMFSFNLHAVHFDENLWGNPNEFNPDRFIAPDGSVTRPNYLIPFGSGRRACTGEALAKVEIFLMFSILMQKFSFQAPKGQPVDLKSNVGFINVIKDYKLQAFPRHEKEAT